MKRVLLVVNLQQRGNEKLIFDVSMYLMCWWYYVYKLDMDIMHSYYLPYMVFRGPRPNKLYVHSTITLRHKYGLSNEIPFLVSSPILSARYQLLAKVSIHPNNAANKQSKR